MTTPDNSVRPVIISAIGSNWSSENSRLLLESLADARSDKAVRCSLPMIDALPQSKSERLSTENLPPNVFAEWINPATPVKQILASSSIAICLASESDQLKRQILCAGVPLIQLDAPSTDRMPEDSVISIRADAHAKDLLKAFLDRLIRDERLRSRMAANSIKFANNHKPGHPGRFPRVKGIDYKRGALEYSERLDKGNRHHLLTKPFYNLRIRTERAEGHGIDEDTRRHFSDFANIAYELALPLDSRILDIGCGPGWLVEYFARFGYSATGIDISPALIEIAKDRLAGITFGVDHETPIRYRFEVLNIESTRLDETFDCIICYDSLHHFEDERAVFENITAMLAENGLFFVLEGARPSEDSEAGRELTRVMRELQTLESPFERQYLLDLLDEFGFAVVGDYTTASGFHNRKSIRDGRLSVEPEHVNYLLGKKLAVAPASIVPTSLDPGTLAAKITSKSDDPISATANHPFPVNVSLINTGDTLWLADGSSNSGMVRFGCKILDNSGEVRVEIHGTPEIRGAMGPKELRRFDFNLVAPAEAGSYKLKIDLLVQDVCWFEEKGSEALELRLNVT